MFGVGVMLFFANTLFRIWAFRLVRHASSTLVKVHPTVCSTSWCLEVPESVGKLNQGLELSLSAVMQSLILVADFLLVRSLPLPISAPLICRITRSFAVTSSSPTNSGCGRLPRSPLRYPWVGSFAVRLSYLSAEGAVRQYDCGDRGDHQRP